MTTTVAMPTTETPGSFGNDAKNALWMSAVGMGGAGLLLTGGYVALKACCNRLADIRLQKYLSKRRFINCLIVFVYVPVRLVFRLSGVVVDHSMSPRLIQQPMTSQNRKRSQRKPKVNRK